MKIINCDQGSEDWYKARLGRATASNFSKLITSTGKISTSLKAYAVKLATELLVDEQEAFYQSDDMIRGNEVEHMACQAYQEHYFTVVNHVGFMSCDNYGYSPDGTVGEDGLVEIKCPKQTTHTEYLYENRLPLKYKAQVQGGLFISGRKWCDFISYDPRFTNKKLFIKRVYRDEEFIDSLKIGLDKVIEMRDKFLTEIRKI